LHPPALLEHPYALHPAYAAVAPNTVNTAATVIIHRFMVNAS
jgi:hypothetical protein